MQSSSPLMPLGVARRLCLTAKRKKCVASAGYFVFELFPFNFFLPFSPFFAGVKPRRVAAAVLTQIIPCSPHRVQRRRSNDGLYHLRTTTALPPHRHSRVASGKQDFAHGLLLSRILSGQRRVLCQTWSRKGGLCRVFWSHLFSKPSSHHLHQPLHLHLLFMLLVPHRQVRQSVPPLLGSGRRPMRMEADHRRP